MFKNYYLSVPGGHLSPVEQDELIRYLLDEARRRPEILQEISSFLEGRSEKISQKAVDFLRSQAYEWLLARNKS